MYTLTVRNFALVVMLKNEVWKANFCCTSASSIPCLRTGLPSVSRSGVLKKNNIHNKAVNWLVIKVTVTSVMKMP